MKAIKEWLNELPEPYRGEALENTEKFPLENKRTPAQIISLAESINYGFDWQKTHQGYDYWSDCSLLASKGVFDKDRIQSLESEVKRLQSELEQKDKESIKIVYLREKETDNWTAFLGCCSGMLTEAETKEQCAKNLSELINTVFEHSGNQYATIQKKDKEIDVLKMSVVIKTQKINSLAEGIQKKDEELKENEVTVAYLDELNKTIEILEYDVKNKDKELAELKEDLDNATKIIKETHPKYISTLNAKIAELETIRCNCGRLIKDSLTIKS